MPDEGRDSYTLSARTWWTELRERAEEEHDERFDVISARADRAAFTVIEPVLGAAFVAALLLTPASVDRDTVLLGLGVLVLVVILTRGVAHRIVSRRAGLDVGSRDMPWTTLRRAILSAVAMPVAVVAV